MVAYFEASCLDATTGVRLDKEAGGTSEAVALSAARVSEAEGRSVVAGDFTQLLGSELHKGVVAGALATAESNHQDFG